MATDNLRDKEYLGDGVYVGHDGFHVVLWLEQPGAYGPHAIAIEGAVQEALFKYLHRVAKEVGL